MKRHLLAILLLALLSFPAVKDLFKPGAYTSHDLTHHIVRTIHMDKLLLQGQFPPRWTDALNYGYGYPLFLFNYPLPSMIAAGIHHLSFDYIWSVKLTFALSMVLSAIFAYILGNYLWTDYRAGFVTGMFYLYVPIRFLNVYVSATFGNAVAFMFIPLVFYSLIKAHRNQATKLSTLAGSLSLAGLMLSHNIMALMFLPIIILFLLLFAHRSGLIPILFGLGLSAWFWLPATLEKGLLRYDTTLTGFYQAHFPTLKQLIRSPWGYGFSHPGTELDDMSFQIGLAHLLVITFSLVILITRLKTRDQLQKTAAFFLFIFFASVFLMLRISNPAWKIIPFLSYLQMPWRLLAVTAFAGSLLAGWLVIASPFKNLTSFFLIIAVIIANRNHWHINQVFDPGEDYYLSINNTTTMASEHLPQGANKFDDFPPSFGKLEFITGQGEITYLRNTAVNVSSVIQNDVPSLLRFNQIYFPGWRYWLDTKPLSVSYEISRPLPQFTLSPGSHQFVAKFHRTPDRLVADIISLVTIIGISGYIILYDSNPTLSRPRHLQRSS